MVSRKFYMIAGFAALIAAPAAHAHEGPKILTQFGGAERASHSGGSVEHIRGVHLYRGAKKLEDSLEGGATVRSAQTLKVEIDVECRQRQFRRLRTQGFYSGTGPKSRRYTQGFYSGR